MNTVIVSVAWYLLSWHMTNSFSHLSQKYIWFVKCPKIFTLKNTDKPESQLQTQMKITKPTKLTYSPPQSLPKRNQSVKEGFFSLIAPFYSPCEPQLTESLFEMSSLSWCQFPDVWYPGWMSDGPGGDNLPHWPL